jgi:hypothetical protein
MKLVKYLAIMLTLASVVSAQQTPETSKLPTTTTPKPRVFVKGKGSEDLTTSGAAGGGRHFASWASNSTLDSHDEMMEVTKDLQADCAGVTVSLNPKNADYVVMLNRESKHNRGLIRTNNQLLVANRRGDVVGSKATHTVRSASKDACDVILTDWQANGSLAGLVPSEPEPPVEAAAKKTTSEVPQPSTPAVQKEVVISTPTTQVAPQQQESLADAARRVKQQKDCAELAKTNPSITCK